MGTPREFMQRHDLPAAWLMRAIIVGLLAWGSGTLLAVDKSLVLLEYRITIMEQHH